jgi:hypothetical protein
VYTKSSTDAQPHDCIWATAGAVKAFRPDLGDNDAVLEVAKAIRWVSINYQDWF